VTEADLITQATVLAGVAVLITVGVYGLVAGIVKLDDAGLWLAQRPGDGALQALGRGMVRGAPMLMKVLTVVGTAAMFLVGGSILLHGIGPLHHWVQALLADLNGLAGTLASMGADAVVGLVAGAIVLAVVTAIQKMRGQPAAAH
jgi:hypothetical protein